MIEKPCTICKKTYTAKSHRSKYCSEACKQKNKRRSDTIETKTIVDTVNTPVKGKSGVSENTGLIQDVDTVNLEFKNSLTKTDQTFYEFDSNYYYFSDARYEKECLYCGEKFETSLKLLRYCSRKHMEGVS